MSTVGIVLIIIKDQIIFKAVCVAYD